MSTTGFLNSLGSVVGDTLNSVTDSVKNLTSGGNHTKKHKKSSSRKSSSKYSQSGRGHSRKQNKASNTKNVVHKALLPPNQNIGAQYALHRRLASLGTPSNIRYLSRPVTSDDLIDSFKTMNFAARKPGRKLKPIAEVPKPRSPSPDSMLSSLMQNNFHTSRKAQQRYAKSVTKGLRKSKRVNKVVQKKQWSPSRFGFHTV